MTDTSTQTPPADPPQPAVRIVEPSAQTTSNNATVTWTNEQVDAERDRVRKEVESRLAPQVAKQKELEERIRTFEEEAATQAKAQKEATKQAEADERKRREAEMDARQLFESQRADFDKYREEQQRQFEELQRQRELDRALYEKERQYAELLTYKTNRVNEAADSIIPQFRDLVTGGSPEEIDSSIQDMITRSNAIIADVQGVQAAQRQAQPTAPITQPPVGPLESVPQTKDLTPEQLQNMDMKEFEKMRPFLGVTKGGRDGSMFR